MLAELGCSVVGPSARADEAMGMAEAGHLDGALLDVNLSKGETSFPVAAILASRGIPFVFVTGYDLDSSFPPEFQSAPRLAKPVDSRGLTRALLQHFAPPASAQGSTPSVHRS